MIDVVIIEDDDTFRKSLAVLFFIMPRNRLQSFLSPLRGNSLILNVFGNILRISSGKMSSGWMKIALYGQACTQA